MLYEIWYVPDSTSGGVNIPLASGGLLEEFGLFRDEAIGLDREKLEEKAVWLAERSASDCRFEVRAA